MFFFYMGFDWLSEWRWCLALFDNDDRLLCFFFVFFFVDVVY